MIHCRIFSDTNEEKKKEEWREAAKRELEEWYKHHDELISKTRAANRYAVFVLISDWLEFTTLSGSDH